MIAAISTVLAEVHEPNRRRWAFAGGLVILIHAAIVFWLVHARELHLAGEPPAAVMIEFAPMDVAPPSESQPEVTPGPQMTEAQPEEVEQEQAIPVPELPAAPKPNVVLMPPRKPKPQKLVKETPKPVVKPVHQPPAPRTSAPPRAAATAARTAGSHASNSAEAAAWRSAWAAALSWSKHYPEAARARGEQGTVRLALVIGRSGHVISARLIGSSGSSTLDQAALEMARNASGRPLPPEMGSSVSLIVPIRYSIR
jgi:protein TonB